MRILGREERDGRTVVLAAVAVELVELSTRMHGYDWNGLSRIAAAVLANAGVLGRVEAVFDGRHVYQEDGSRAKGEMAHAFIPNEDERYFEVWTTPQA